MLLLVSERRVYGVLAGLLALLLAGAATVLGLRAEERPEHAAPAAPESLIHASDEPWVGTWSAAPAGTEAATRDGLPDRSVRNVVRTSVGGTSVRIELSNRYGSQPVTFTSATMGLAQDRGPGVIPRSMRPVTFDGQPSVSIPVGQSVTSDPVALDIPATTDLVISVYAPGPSGPVTYHQMARQTGYLASGDRTGDHSGAAYSEVTEYWRYLTGVHVLSPYTDGAVVVLGDSLTDSITSTPNANRRWTDFLNARLQDEPDTPHYAVLNQGISGNRLLRDGAPDRAFNGMSGLRRLHSDVLPQPGARTLVLQLGINDLIRAPQVADPRELLAGMRQLVTEAREGGLRVVGATLGPMSGHRAYTPDLEAVRQEVNAQIRAGGVFDAVIDFDVALHDPSQPDRLRPAYDSGDHLHPSDAGYRAMAYAVDLATLVDSGAEASL